MIIPANTELTCPVCDTAFKTKTMLQDEARLVCSNCDASLIVIDGDLEEFEEDIFEDIEEDDNEEDFEDEVDLEAEKAEDEQDRRMEEERKKKL